MSKKHYAVVAWSLEDIKQRKPDWDIDRCRLWIEQNERGIEEALTQIGNDLLDNTNFIDPKPDKYTSHPKEFSDLVKRLKSKKKRG
jgi:hypothetical protein